MSITANTRLRVYRYDDFTCRYCFRQPPDHDGERLPTAEVVGISMMRWRR